MTKENMIKYLIRKQETSEIGKNVLTDGLDPNSCYHSIPFRHNPHLFCTQSLEARHSNVLVQGLGLHYQSSHIFYIYPPPVCILHPHKFQASFLRQEFFLMLRMMYCVKVIELHTLYKIFPAHILQALVQGLGLHYRSSHIP